jgi:hypothetical protein
MRPRVMVQGIAQKSKEGPSSARDVSYASGAPIRESVATSAAHVNCAWDNQKRHGKVKITWCDIRAG